MKQQAKDQKKEGEPQIEEKIESEYEYYDYYDEEDASKSKSNVKLSLSGSLNTKAYLKNQLK